MEIDGLDDFDIQFRSTIDLPLTKWHGHQVLWFFRLRAQLHSQAIKVQDFVGESLNPKTAERNAWAGSNALTHFYRNQKWVPNQVFISSAMSVITGRISLRELLSADYLNQEVQIVPFTLDWDANLPFIALPEGTSWAELQAPIAGVFQSYFPHGLDYLTLSPNWWNSSDLHAINQVNGYLQAFDSQYAGMVSTAQTKAVESAMQSAQLAMNAATRATEAATASSQAHSPYTAIDQAEIAQESAKQAKDIALTAEQESVTLGAFAQAKIQVAAAEKQKAIDATTKAVFATRPPYLGRTGSSLTKQQKYVLQAWNEERLKTATEAEIQTNRAALAEQEAKIATAIANGKKQAVVNAKAQAQIAEKSAIEAGTFAAKLIASPSQPIFYIERGLAYFGMGEYDLSLKDYHQFVSRVPEATSFSTLDFSKGLATGLVKGGWNSIEGVGVFLKDFLGSPIHTSQQIYNSCCTLVNLACNDEWGVIAEVLSPELCQLVKQWNTLSDYQKGNLAGYALGKHGGDLLAPGALAKVASKSVKSAKELATFCKEIQFAQETLILETAAGIGNGAKIAEVIRNGQTMAFLGEELGFTAEEISQLKKLGKLEQAIDSAFERLINKPGYEVLKTAVNEEKHVRFIIDYFDKPAKELYRRKFKNRENVFLPPANRVR